MPHQPFLRRFVLSPTLLHGVGASVGFGVLVLFAIPPRAMTVQRIFRVGWLGLRAVLHHLRPWHGCNSLELQVPISTSDEAMESASPFTLLASNTVPLGNIALLPTMTIA